MYKQIALIILFSIIAIFFQSQLSVMLHYLVVFHHQLIAWSSSIFNVGPVGRKVQAVIALLILPLIVGIIVALISWFFRKKTTSYAMTAAWIVWVILVVTLLAKI